MQPLLELFLDQARYCKSVEELSLVIEGIFKDIGFDMWGYQTESDIALEKSAPIIIHNFPQKWVNYYINNNFSEVDPVIKYGTSLTMPFQWSQLNESNNLNKESLEFNDLAKDFGLDDGLGIPLIGGNGRRSMISLVSDTNPKEMASLFKTQKDQIVAMCFAFHSIAKDLIKDDNLTIKKGELSDREKECLLWAIKGKSSWETGMILGISERTVIFHINNAKKKFNVVSKYHLIAIAISEGHIKI